MALPSFLCIGATKAGTSWLNEQLECHPGVCMPVVKELHYFSAISDPTHREWATKSVAKAFRRELRRARQQSGEPARAMVRHIRGLMALEQFSPAWYRACFDRPDHAGGVCGEITPAYAELSDAGIETLLALLPQVRIIHLLRHPVSRALSHLRMAAHRRETPATEQALLQLLDDNPALLSRGEYQTQIPRWQRHIPAERLLIRPFGMVRDTPLQLLQEVERFIGVPAFDAYPVAEQVNSTRSIEIPAAVVAAVTERVQPTVDFLRQTYGEAFLQATQ